MRKQMIETAAFEVATQVRAVEDVIENALAEIAELQARMIRARAAAGIATATGHEAFEQLADAIQGLVSARGGMANCHGALVEAKQFVPGLRTVVRRQQECPPAAAPTFASSRDRIDRAAPPWSGRPTCWAIIFSPLLLAVCGLRLVARRDRRANCRRRPALAATVATMLTVSPLPAAMRGIEGAVLVDLAVLAGFFAVALRSSRFWPLWVAGLQLTTSLRPFASRRSTTICAPGLWRGAAILELSDPPYPRGRHLARASPPARRRLSRARA